MLKYAYRRYVGHILCQQKMSQHKIVSKYVERKYV